MPDPNLLALNEDRAFPFGSDRPPTMVRSDAAEVDLPTEAIVDFRTVVGPAAGWRGGSDRVTLAQVRRTGDRFAFEFRATAPGLAGHAVTFERDLDAPEYAGDAADARPLGLGSGGSSAGSSLGADADADCLAAVLWMATLTTGRLDGLAAVLASGQSLSDPGGLMAVEPALVQDLAGTLVTSVNVGNRARIHATAPAGCAAEPAAEYPDGTPLVYASCLAGAIVLREGFNCAIRQNDRDNSLTIAAAVGAGAGTPCAEVEVYPGERGFQLRTRPEPPAPLTGGPYCGDTIAGINGLSGAALRLEGGAGVAVVADPDNPHTLIVTVGLDELAVCPTFVDSSYPSDG